jgi:glycosyltransferase involved in cell wall biosynthesis
VQYTDLHLFTGDTSKSKEELLNKFASNINYVFFMPENIKTTFVIHASFSEEFTRQTIKFSIKKNSAFTALAFIKLFYLIKRSGTQVVLMHGMIKPLHIIAAGIVFGKQIRILIQNHAETPYRRIRWPLQIWASEFVSGFLFTSVEQGKPWIDAGIIKNEELIHEVMEGSTAFQLKDKNMAKKEFGEDDKTIFIWVGRLDKNKDPLTILKAFAQYIKENSNSRLWMIYSSTVLLEEVMDYIRENRLEGFVELKGKIEHERLEDYYNAADYFILGSHHEGSGYALCEAMACGCVPIVTSIPSFKMMLDNGTCGYMFEPGDHETLYKILQQLNQADKENYKAHVIDKFKRDLSFEAIAKRIAGIVFHATSITAKTHRLGKPSRSR